MDKPDLVTLMPVPSPSHLPALFANSAPPSRPSLSYSPHFFWFSFRGTVANAPVTIHPTSLQTVATTVRYSLAHIAAAVPTARNPIEPPRSCSCVRTLVCSCNPFVITSGTFPENDTSHRGSHPSPKGYIARSHGGSCCWIHGYGDAIVTIYADKILPCRRSSHRWSR